MFHRAIKLKILPGTAMEVTFQDGKVMRYDMSRLFGKYPQLMALEDWNLFKTAKLYHYGIIWNDELDIDTESIYENGELVRIDQVSSADKVALMVKDARLSAGLSQKQLAELTGIDQADISKIESGAANPSLTTLDRIAKALDNELVVIFSSVAAA